MGARKTNIPFHADCETGCFSFISVPGWKSEFPPVAGRPVCAGSGYGAGVVFRAPSASSPSSKRSGWPQNMQASSLPSILVTFPQAGHSTCGRVVETMPLIMNNAVLKIAAAKNAMLIDIREAFLKTRDYMNLLCEDGIHPNEAGHALISDVIMKALPALT